MLEKLLNLIKLVFILAESWQKFETKVEAKLKEHSERLRELADNQARLYYEFQLEKERNAHEREKSAMRQENQELRERLERLERLALQPPPTKSPDETED